MKLTIIIPCYNEEDTIAEVIQRVKDVSIPIEKEILIINDGSTDKTPEILSKIKGVRVITHATNQGKGVAIQTGIKNATGNIVIIQDADLEYSPENIPSLIKPIIDGKADVVLGSRFLGQHKGMTKSHFVGNKILTYTARVLYGHKLTDVMTGYKVFRKEVLESLELKSKEFEIETELVAKVLKKNYRIVEVPISYGYRKKGESKIGWKHGFISLQTLLKLRFEVSLYVIAAIFVLAVYLLYAANSQGGEPDDYNHFLMARYTPAHPTIFLNSWAKPFYTILVSLTIALTGNNSLFAARLVNSILATGCTILVGYIVNELTKDKITAFSAIILTAFTLEFFKAAYSALTETSFAFLLALSLAFYYKGKFTASALALSLSTLARLEGFIFIPLFLIFAPKKSVKSVIPALLLFPLLWALFDWYFLGDALLIFEMHPIISPYGPGSLGHYVLHMSEILGIASLILFAVGLIFTLPKKEYALIHTFFIAFLFFHSFIWAFNLLGSAGYLRYFAAIGPIFGFYIALGLFHIQKYITEKRSSPKGNLTGKLLAVKIVLAVVIMSLAVSSTIYFASPHGLYPQDQAAVQAGGFIKQRGFTSSQVYIFHPATAYYAGVDPFVHSLLEVKGGVPRGSVVVWDSDNSSPFFGLTREYLDSAGFNLLKEFSSNNLVIAVYQKVD